MGTIEGMPWMAGAQFYPGGMPLPAKAISFNGRTILDIFLEKAGDDEIADDPYFVILNNYYRYFLLAPCWDLGEITEEEVLKADGQRLFEICLDCGLDPI